jgi:hypothetical protein
MKNSYIYFLAIILVFISGNVKAAVSAKNLKGEFFEGKYIEITGRKLDREIKLTTIDKDEYFLTALSNKKRSKLKLQLPLVTNDTKVKLTVKDRTGESTINIIIYNDPNIDEASSDYEGLLVLDENTTTGFIGIIGPEGPEGPTGPQGQAGSFPPSYQGERIIGSVNSALTVVNASQSNISTLSNLTNVGKTGVNTVFAGPIVANEGITGDIVGDASNFTGSLSGDITGTQSATVLAASTLFAKTLQNTYLKSAGTVAIGDTLEQAIEKIVANQDTNTNNISTHDALLVSHQASIDSFTTDISDNTSNITTNTNNINSNDTDIATNAGNITTNAGNITTNISNITANANEISYLKAKQTINLSGATSFNSENKSLTLLNDSSGPGTLNTITGAEEGQKIVIIFQDTINVTDNDSASSNTINLQGSTTDFAAGQYDTLQLIYDGTSWYEISRSVNL